MDAPALHHFRLHFYAAVARALSHADALGDERASERLRFLDAYADELHASGIEGAGAGEWAAAIEAFEAEAPAGLPLRALRLAARLDHTAIMLLCAAGLVEEDPRFAHLFAALQGSGAARRPTQAMLCTVFQEDGDPAPIRARLRALIDLGALEAQERSLPRAEWTLQVAPP